MKNPISNRNAKWIIRIIGGILFLNGVFGLANNLIRWRSGQEGFLFCNTTLDILILAGGLLLLFLKKAGLEIMFIFLRLFLLIGIVGAIGGLVAGNLVSIVLGAGIILPILGLMIFLSSGSIQKAFTNPNHEEPLGEEKE